MAVTMQHIATHLGEIMEAHRGTLKEWALDRPYFGRYPATVQAYTKGEACAMFKRLLKERLRLPIGYTITEVVV